MKDSPRTLLPSFTIWREAAGLVLLLALGCQTQAATYVSGTVNQATWTKANSPYYMSGDIQVNGPLTIEPGVRVLLQSSSTFQVYGQLLAVGATNDPIVFTRTDSGGWQGIYFYYTTSPSQLINCVVSNAVNSGIRIYNPTAIPLISGCTLANNSTTGDGGGLWASLSAGSLTLSNCTFTGNTTSSGNGGGLRASLSAGSLTLSNCTFVGNTASGNGGAICADMPAGNFSLTNCTIASNSAGFHGGGLYADVYGNRLLLKSCVLQGNAAYPSGTATRSAHGGGLSVSGEAILADCSILNNSCRAYAATYASSDAQGAGIYSYGSGQLAMTRCIVSGNTGAGAGSTLGTRNVYGGGVFRSGGTLASTNCIFMANTCSGGSTSAGGIRASGSTVQLVNCTCTYNSPEGLVCDSGSIANSIFFFNSGTQVTGSVAVVYSDVQNGYAGTGNLNINPLFQSSTDMHLSPTSACIDAGNPAAAFNDLWFPPSTGTVRNDLGAYGGPLALDAAPPRIVSQSRSQLASCPEQNLPLFVEVSGAQPTSCQWWYENSPLPGQTNTTLALTNLGSTSAGCYWAVVTNVYGCVTSAPVRLAVNDFCLNVQKSGGYACLTVAGASGSTCVLSWTTDLDSPDGWRPLATNSLSSAPWVFVDLESPASPHRFYKANRAP